MTLHYLDELNNREKPESGETREEVRELAKSWIKGGYCAESLEDAFRLWDAVRVVPVLFLFSSLFSRNWILELTYAGGFFFLLQVYAAVKVAGKEEIKDFEMWAEVDEWLKGRR